MNYSELKTQCNDIWKNQKQIEKNIEKSLKGLRLQKKIQTANYEVNKERNDFFSSQRYKDIKQNVKAERERGNNEFFYIEEADSYFYMYINKENIDYYNSIESSFDGISLNHPGLCLFATLTLKPEDIPSYDNLPTDINQGNDEDICIRFDNVWDINNLKERYLKDIDRIRIQYNDTFAILNTKITDEYGTISTNPKGYITGQALYDIMCTPPEKTVHLSKSRKDLADEILYESEDKSEAKKEESPAD